MTVTEEERAARLAEFGYESDRDAIETAIDLAKSDRTSTWEEALRLRPNRIRPYDGDEGAEGTRSKR